MYKYLYIEASENESFTINDLMSKVITFSKNIKTLTELIKNIDEKYTNLKAIAKTIRRRWIKSLKKQIGRPSGSFQDKQKQYMGMLNKNKFKSPKQETIEFYKLFKNEEGKYETIILPVEPAGGSFKI